MTNQSAFEQVTDAVVDAFMAPMNGELGTARMERTLAAHGWTVAQYEIVVVANGINSTSHRGGW